MARMKGSPPENSFRRARARSLDRAVEPPSAMRRSPGLASHSVATGQPNVSAAVLVIPAQSGSIAMTEFVWRVKLSQTLR